MYDVCSVVKSQVPLRCATKGQLPLPCYSVTLGKLGNPDHFLMAAVNSQNVIKIG